MTNKKPGKPIEGEVIPKATANTPAIAKPVTLPAINTVLDDTELVELEKQLSVIPDDIDVVREQRNSLVKLKTAFEAARKAGKAPAIEWGKGLDEQTKALQARVAALLEPRRLLILADDEEKEKAKAARKAAKKAKEDRLKDMMRDLMGLSNNLYTIEDCEKSLAAIKLVNPDDFDEHKKVAAAQLETGLEVIESRLATLQAEKKAAEAAAEEKRIADEAAAEEKRIADEAAAKEKAEAAAKQKVIDDEAAARKKELDEKEAELKARQDKLDAEAKEAADAAAAEAKRKADLKAAEQKKAQEKADQERKLANDKKYRETTQNDRTLLLAFNTTMNQALEPFIDGSYELTTKDGADKLDEIIGHVSEVSKLIEAF